MLPKPSKAWLGRESFDTVLSSRPEDVGSVTNSARSNEGLPRQHNPLNGPADRSPAAPGPVPLTALWRHLSACQVDGFQRASANLLADDMPWDVGPCG